MTHPQEQPNKYPGRCACCCEHVEAGAGFLETRELYQVPDAAPPLGVFARGVYCASCFRLYGPPLFARGRPMPLPPTGHYAIGSRGANDLIFLKFQQTFGLSASLRPVLKMVVGGKPDHRVTGNEAISYLSRIVNEGVEASSRLYAQELGRCSRCNRTLTDEASRARGLGPECATR